MRRSSTRLACISLMVLGVLVVSGCQGDGTGLTPTTAATLTPEAPTDDVDEATDVLSAADASRETTGDDAPQTTAALVAAPTSEDAPTTPEDEKWKWRKRKRMSLLPGGVVVVQEGTVFTTPAQAAYCSLSAPAGGMAAAITCEVEQSSVPADAELMGYCPSEGYVWYFNFFEDAGHAGFLCNHHDGIVHMPGLDLADDPWVD